MYVYVFFLVFENRHSAFFCYTLWWCGWYVMYHSLRILSVICKTFRHCFVELVTELIFFFVDTVPQSVIKTPSTRRQWPITTVYSCDKTIICTVCPIDIYSCSDTHIMYNMVLWGQQIIYLNTLVMLFSLKCI